MFRIVHGAGVAALAWRQAGDAVVAGSATANPRKAHRTLTGNTALLQLSYGAAGTVLATQTVKRDNHRVVYSRGRLVRYAAGTVAEETPASTGGGTDAARQREKIRRKVEKLNAEILAKVEAPETTTSAKLVKAISKKAIQQVFDEDEDEVLMLLLS